MRSDTVRRNDRDQDADIGELGCSATVPADDGDDLRPDLADPVTLGGLEGLARKAWGEDYLIEVVIEWADVAWIEVVKIEPRDRSAEPRAFGHSDRAEAWVAALTGAPGERRERDDALERER